MKKWIFALLLLLMFLVTAHAATAQVQVTQAYVYGAGAQRTATYPTGLQNVGTVFVVQNPPANSTWKLSYYNPGGSLVTTASGAYNNPAPQPGTTTTFAQVVPRGLVLTKGDWHIQIAINGQAAKDIYFSAGLASLVFDHAIVIGSDFRTEKTVFSPGVNQIGGTVWVSNLPAGWWMRLRYQRPDGTIAADNTWDPQYPNGFNSGSIGLHYFVNLDQTGTWHLIYDLDGQPLSTLAFNVIEPQRKSVLLVHGTWSNAARWDGAGGMSETLRNNGYIVEAVNFPIESETRSNETHIEAQARALARRIKELKDRSGSPQTSLICHSMGGLAARYYLEHPEMWQVQDASGKLVSGVEKLVMLGTPNWGTDSAFLDPVASITVARLSTQPLAESGLSSTAVDTVNNWSPAVQEMFAEWQPAPAQVGSSYSYPKNYKLASWPLGQELPFASVSYQSPIQPLSYGFANAIVAYLDAGSPFNSDVVAIADVLGAFPFVNPRARRRNHLAYYPQMAQKLGVPYPQMSGGVDGVDKRLVSPFLLNLNVNNIGNLLKSGTHVYMVAGTYPVAFDPSFNYPGGWAKVISSPFNSDLFNGGIDNDGVVPTDSAIGRDPITGQYLFPNAKKMIIDTFHTNLPDNADVISQVIAWLGE